MTPESVQSLIAEILKGLAPRTLLDASLTVRGTEVATGTETFDLSRHSSVQVIGLGKAAVPQSEAFLEMIRDAGAPVRLAPPLAFTKYGHGTGRAGIQVRESGHPVCDERSAASGAALLEAVRRLDRDALLVLLLSGGASSLAVSPIPPFTLEDKARTSEALLASGAPIEEMNAIRREMSAIKNGGLAAECGARSIVALITADVPTGDLASVGSGPTCLETDPPAKLVGIARHRLAGAPLAKFESYVLSEAREAKIRGREAALKRKRIVNHRLADASTLRDAALSALSARFGRAAATEPFELSSRIEDGVEAHVKLVPGLVRSRDPGALVSGGELGVVVRGRGRGGRNTEFALRAARAIFEENRAGLREADLSRLTIAAIGTDGTDGPTDAAGAWIDLAGYREARALGLDAGEILSASDSYEYFRRIDRLVRTGPTGTNLMDLRMVLAEPC